MTAGARFGVVLALFAAVGCGRSIRQNADDGFGGSSGGTQNQGGSSGSSAGRGGFSQGGFGATAGAGGENTERATILLQSNGVLSATDLEGAESIELCPRASGLVRYSLVDWVDESAIVFRENINPAGDSELLRVALDGSECTSFYSGTIRGALSPVVGGRVVLKILPVGLGVPEPLPDAPSAFGPATMGLLSVALDGTGVELLPDVMDVWIVGDRVLFTVLHPTTGFDVYTALPDASIIERLLPISGGTAVSLASGRRVVVPIADNDVYAVDVDGSRVVPLATAPEMERAAAIVGDQVIIERATSATVLANPDLLRVGLEGGELVPLTTTPGGELFVGATSDRIFYEHASGGLASDLYSVGLEGGEPTRITDTPDIGESLGGVAGDRVLFVRSDGGVFSARFDGSDTVTLHPDSQSVVTIVDDRAVLYVEGLNIDIVSVHAAGGDPVVLADYAGDDWVVGKLGSVLVIQRGPLDGEREVFAMNADGSRAVSLSPAARYVGAVTEACGAVPGSQYELSKCPD